MTFACIKAWVSSGTLAFIAPAIAIFLMPQSGFCAGDTERCWRGRPSPQCDQFWITQFAVGGRLNAPGDSTRDSSVASEYVLYDIGPMFNRGSKTALGATVSIRLTNETYVGVYGRYRRWIDENWALDLSPGVLLIGSSNDDDYDLVYPSVAGRVGLVYGDWIGASCGFEVARIRDKGSDVDWFADVHAGYYPGAAAGILFALLAVAVSSSLAAPP